MPCPRFCRARLLTLLLSASLPCYPTTSNALKVILNILSMWYNDLVDPARSASLPTVRRVPSKSCSSRAQFFQRLQYLCACLHAVGPILLSPFPSYRFTDPHPLTPLESYRFKERAGRGPSRVPLS